MNILVIKKENLRHNIKQIKKIIDESGKDDRGNPIKIIATIREDAYELGIVEYTKFLIENGITFFAVETIQEGIKLREAGIKEEILMLSSTAIKEDIEILAKNNIIITLTSKEDIEAADKIGKKINKKIRAHININTGNSLNGFSYLKTDEMIESLKTMQNIKIEGTYSEFIDSTNNDKLTKIQFKRFIDVIEVLQMNEIPTGMLHICDSAAFLKFSTMNLNAVRIEKAFLGEVPKANQTIFRKVVHLETYVAEIKKIPKGSYLNNQIKYKIKKEMKIAIIPYNGIIKNKTKISKEMYKTIDKIKYMVYNLKKQNKYLTINKKNCKIIGIVKGNIICEIGDNDVKIGEKVLLPINGVSINSYVRREYR